MPIKRLRDEVRSRGFLETDDTDRVTSTSRSHFNRAKTDLIEAKRFIEDKGQFWKLEPDRKDENAV